MAEDRQDQGWVGREAVCRHVVLAQADPIEAAFLGEAQLVDLGSVIRVGLPGVEVAIRIGPRPRAPGYVRPRDRVEAAEDHGSTSFPSVASAWKLSISAVISSGRTDIWAMARYSP